MTLKINTTLSQKFLFSFIKDFFFFSPITNLVFTLFATLIFNFFFICKIVKISDELLKISCLLILALISMPHWGHDYILLVPLFIHSLKNYKKNLFLIKFNLFVSVYFLHFYNKIPQLIFKSDINIYFHPLFFEIALLLITLILNLSIFSKKLPKAFF